MADTPAVGFEAIQKEIKGIEAAIIPLITTQSEEIAKHGETATATSKALKALEAKYDERMKDLDAVRSELAEFVKEAGDAALPGSGKAPTSHGHAFTNSEEFKAIAGTSLEQVRPVNVKSFHQKALFTGASIGTLDAYTYPGRRLPGFYTEPDADMHVRDLLPVTPTNDASIEYVVRTGDRWIAGIQESEGDKKLEQSLGFTVEQANPVTIAHWLPITKQALKRTAQLEAYIEGELTYGIKLKEDEQLLYGDGSAGNLQGLMTNAGVRDYGASGRAKPGDTRIDTLRRAITVLRLGFYRPSGVVVNPNDWEAIELQKDGENRYLWVSVTDGGVPRLWRVPVVETPVINEDEFLMGDFRIGAHLWDLERARIETGYVNDDFVRNRLALLGEEDVIFTTELPKAFIKGDFGAVSS